MLLGLNSMGVICSWQSLFLRLPQSKRAAPLQALPSLSFHARLGC
jgi:hypothetical protein